LMGYLKAHQDAQTTYIITLPVINNLNFVDNNWKDLYPDAEQKIPDNAPKPAIALPLRVAIFVNANHADNLGTC
jgi:hypothetical protein